MPALGAGGRRFKSCRPDHEGFAVHGFQFTVRCLETAVHGLTAAIATMPWRDSDESHKGSPHLETVLTVRSRTETGNRERRTVERKRVGIRRLRRFRLRVAHGQGDKDAMCRATVPGLLNSREKAQRAQKIERSTEGLQASNCPVSYLDPNFFALFVPFCGYSDFASGKRYRAGGIRTHDFLESCLRTSADVHYEGNGGYVDVFRLS